VRAGRRTRAVSQRIGHASVGVTMKVYARTPLREMMEAMLTGPIPETQSLCRDLSGRAV